MKCFLISSLGTDYTWWTKKDNELQKWKFRGFFFSFLKNMLCFHLTLGSAKFNIKIHE